MFFKSRLRFSVELSGRFHTDTASYKELFYNSEYDLFLMHKASFIALSRAGFETNKSPSPLALSDKRHAPLLGALLDCG